MARREPIKPDSLPLFAQPVGALKYSQPSPGVRVFSSSVTLFALPVVACAVLLTVARPNDAQNLSAAQRAAEAKRAGRPIVLAQNDGKAAPSVAPSTDPATRRPLDYYTQGVRGNLFSAPQPPPAPRPKPVAAPVVKIEKPRPAPIIQVAPINPFADWAYTGTIHIGEQMMALLENTKTKEGQYLKIGDSFLGAQVSSITDQGVTLLSAGKPALLAKSDSINVTPLDKNAAGYGGAQNPPAPNPNGGPPPPAAQPTGLPALGASTVTLPNGRVLTAEQAARRARRLNRGFNQ